MAPQNILSIVGIPPSDPSIQDSVLLVIDVQYEYFEGLLRITDVETSRPVIHSVVEKYRNAGSDVIHIVHDSPEGAPIFTPGTRLAEIADELKPLETEPVVHKRFATSFTETTLKQHLDKIGKKKLVLVGYMAHNCVSATARIGSELGYEIIVVRDAVGDRELPDVTAKELVRVSLAELADTVATIVDSKDLH
ncbi:isochorismatase hydrolase [Xylariales sp. PMI_506]|nr:isochorismatase hydrolase [Xylariales sp. PMI_506]